MSHCPNGWEASRSTQRGAWRPLHVMEAGHSQPPRVAEQKASRGFEPRSLDSESRVLTVTPRGQMLGGHLEAQWVSAALIPMQPCGSAEINSDTFKAPVRVEPLTAPPQTNSMHETPTVGLEPTTTRLRALRSAD